MRNRNFLFRDARVSILHLNGEHFVMCSMVDRLQDKNL